MVFVQRSNTFSSLRITANNVTNTYNFTSTQESNFILGSNGASKKESRLYSSEDISARISDGFTKPTSNSLVAEVFDDTFRLYRPSDVYTNECRFVYLKDPRRVDVNMGINCDISEDFHHEIVDNAINRVKAMISAGTYKSYLMENLKVE